MRVSKLQSSISAFTRLTAPTPAPEKKEILDNKDDEILHLDIEAALCPAGMTSDTFSPAAYKTFQMNAMGLVQKIHEAYRARTLSLRALEDERDKQKGHLIEAQTRVVRFKYQVEDMTRQAAEQERSMMELMNELAAEKRARIAEKDAREKNLNVVPETPESVAEDTLEDLGVDEAERQRKWRKSIGTIRSDVSFDTDEEGTEVDSVFSRSRSPTIPLAGLVETPSSTPVRNKATASFRPHRSRSSTQISAFQKLLKGMTKSEEEDAFRNCRGQDASVAWDTVSLLKDENKALKIRIGELEEAVDSAIDILRGIGM